MMRCTLILASDLLPATGALSGARRLATGALGNVPDAREGFEDALHSGYDAGTVQEFGELGYTQQPVACPQRIFSRLGRLANDRSSPFG